MALKFAALCMLVLVAATGVRAQEEEEVQQTEEAAATEQAQTDDAVAADEGLTASPSLETSVFFVESPVERSFPAGEDLTILVGMRNVGQLLFNVTNITASLTAPTDFKFRAYNFSTVSYHEIISPGDESTFAYRLHLESALDPRTFGFVVVTTYSDETGARFQATVFEDVIRITDAKDNIDTRTLLIGLAVTTAIAIGAFFFIRTQNNNKKKSRSIKAVERGTVSAEASADWLQGTNASLTKRKPATSSK
eukprot:TRINITY_DN1313_c0_g1_i1.p2 TRINITY_DN1313_c0_g1~~TRINITY_DN1313_c0_g1_i1.p2  ORF type:complete len:258 (-),score=80.94 TRINITY_DN1313_c0_g1_i1:22-774(-)